MATTNLAPRIAGLRALIDPINRFLEESFCAELVGKPGESDFALGNPHEMPLPGVVEALQRWAAPHNKDWYAHKKSEPQSQQVVAASLRASHGLPFEPQGVAMAID